MEDLIKLEPCYAVSIEVRYGVGLAKDDGAFLKTVGAIKVGDCNVPVMIVGVAGKFLLMLLRILRVLHLRHDFDIDGL